MWEAGQYEIGLSRNASFSTEPGVLNYPKLYHPKLQVTLKAQHPEPSDPYEKALSQPIEGLLTSMGKWLLHQGSEDEAMAKFVVARFRDAGRSWSLGAWLRD